MPRRILLALWTLVMTLASISCAAGRWEGIRVAAEGVRFQVRLPDATTIAVAGDFNGWSPASHLMTRDGDRWTALIPLPRGEHLFMYVVDGMTWMAPPNAAEMVPDGFGGSNARVVVP